MNSDKLTINMLSKRIHGLPKVFLNIGIGPSRNGSNREAEVIAETYPDIKIIGFEPVIDLFIKRQVDYPGELYPWGLWSEPSIKTMMVKPDTGQSSILKHIKEDHAYLETLISCTTLDHIDCAIQYPDDVFIWMDIEGAELEALRGGHKLLQSGRTKWIVSEVAHKPKRIGQPKGRKLTEHLKQYGFIPSIKYGYSKTAHNILYVME